MKIFSYTHSANKFSVYVYKNISTLPAPHTYLSSDELVRLKEIKNEMKIKEFLYSRYYLKTLLSEKLQTVSTNIEFVTTGKGKPKLKKPHSFLDFNLSHSDEYLVIGISEYGSIGVDIEQIRAVAKLSRISDKMLTDNEKVALKASTDETLDFIKIWAAKEATVKNQAGGMLTDAKKIAINVEMSKLEALPPEYGDITKWELLYLPALEDYIISIAFKNN